ncbi:AfsR/SARP family transcriptional regulator [Natronoglycomyces albus]|uniref:Winged helix-turn-helix domain-containing protein n=1 Tax=Natronoglycomyces albus TaxID=2811108 RepID=A0A895XKA8_9ACTN|nr:BTAD domain-containing putative transcriptional regulator [Natronoglycomyces albus]QSB03993.1 winged helix-turn-helix domain-containing protein [Natronoglycomyces albus]
MQFGVLGPLQVWTDDGSPVEVRERKVRLLLAALILEPGRVVSADCLIDSLWGRQLPAKPTAALQTKVSQLRRDLESAEAGGRKLVRHIAGGYQLDVDKNAVDAGRFAELVNQCNNSDNPHSVVQAAEQALALWRGDALGELASEPFALSAINRWQELRLIAQERRLAAKVELGEQADAIPEIAELVGDHPRRETLRALHMEALYLVGRHEEALESFHQLRSRLDEDSGLRPGPRLRSLYLDILRHDSRLSHEECHSGNLPADLNCIIGRERDVKDITSLLEQHRLVSLVGPGGVGKTRLAFQVAREHTRDRQRPAWLVELGTVPGQQRATCEWTVDDIAYAIIRALPAQFTGPPPPCTDDQPITLRECLGHVLRGQDFLLVLDNYEHVRPAAAQVVSDLLHAVPGVSVLATGRAPLHIPAEQRWPVAPLGLPSPDTATVSGAMELFRQRASASAPDFALTEDNIDQVEAICRRLDALPLALELAASQVATLGIAELARRLNGGVPLPPVRRWGVPDRQRTMSDTLEWSWSLLNEDQRMVVRRLSAFRGPFTLTQAVALCGDSALSLVHIDEIIAELVDQSLLQLTTTDAGVRYAMLETTANFGRSKLRQSGEFDDIMRRAQRAARLARR